MATKDDTQKYSVPQPSKRDLAHGVARAALGAIPVGGAAAVEIFSAVFTPPLVQRRDKWMEQVGEGLHKLEKLAPRTLEALTNNDDFIDVVSQATMAAVRTTRKEKLDSLRNAVSNSLDRDAPEFSIQQMFISFIDSLTEWHLVILKWLGEGVIVHHSPDSVEEAFDNSLKCFFPELSDKKYFYMQVIFDLSNRGLIPNQPIKGKAGHEYHEYGKATELGEQFIRFISNPNFDEIRDA